MLIGIDHLVVAVRDLATAEAEFAERVGLACTGGGRHEAMGTANRLAFLGDTYVELIAVEDRSLVMSSTSFAVGRAALALLESGREGLATYALTSDALEADATTLRAAGSPIGMPVAGSRTRPDGDVVRWLTAFPALGRERAPFLIEHAYEGAEWGFDARSGRAAFTHPAGGRVRLAALELPVADPAAVATEYADVLGVIFDDGRVADVGAGQRVTLLAGGGLPVARLTGDPRTPALATEALGIRWVREPRASDGQEDG